MLAGVLEELERLNAFSSYFTGEAGRARLTMIDQLGFGSDEMMRRKGLLERRFG